MGVVAIFILLFAGLVAHDTELLEYPWHYDEFVEKYLEFLSNPFSPSYREFRSEVLIASGEWRISVDIYRTVRKSSEDWLENVPAGATITSLKSDWRLRKTTGHTLRELAATENATRAAFIHDAWETVETIATSGHDAFPGSLTLDIPAVAEKLPGQKSAGPVLSAHAISFRDVRTGRTFTPDVLFFLRKRDRSYKLVHSLPWNGMDARTYTSIMTASSTWKARIREYPNGTSRIILYLDEFP